MSEPDAVKRKPMLLSFLFCVSFRCRHYILKHFCTALRVPRTRMGRSTVSHVRSYEDTALSAPQSAENTQNAANALLFLSLKSPADIRLCIFHLI